jgi:hypothetical protein
VFPEIVPGCGGVVAVATVNVLAGLLPHELFALTETVPPVLPGVVVILLVVELPVQPLGKVQV